MGRESSKYVLKACEKFDVVVHTSAGYKIQALPALQCIKVTGRMYKTDQEARRYQAFLGALAGIKFETFAVKEMVVFR
jgi:hypothetical protein